MVQIIRKGKSLFANLTVDGTPCTTAPTINLSTACQPIDVRLHVTGGAASVSWRAADMYPGMVDGWQADSPLPLPSAVAGSPKSLDSAWIVVTLLATVTLTDGSTLTTSNVSLGLPQFIDQSSLNGTPAPRNAPPLLLVAPEELSALPIAPAEVKFYLQVPATDLKTWDRWYAMDLWLKKAGTSAATRQNAWAMVFEYANPDKSIIDPPDISIDDPAVFGMLVELAPLLVEADSISPETIWLGQQPQQPGSQMNGVQSQPVAFIINTIDSAPAGSRTSVGASPAGDPSSTTVTITVAEGEIWELRIYPAVQKVCFGGSGTYGDQRFPTGFADDCAPYPPTSPDKYLFPPWRLVIEAATLETILADPGSKVPEESLSWPTLYRLATASTQQHHPRSHLP